MDLVLVEWVDSVISGGHWQPLADCDIPPATVLSVGWLQEHDTYIVVLPHWSPATKHTTEDCQGAMTIPRSAITRLVKLAPAEKSATITVANGVYWPFAVPPSD